MKYLSVCSGIEAASVAWEPLGWEPLAFSEIEPFPRAVLEHHYPHVPCHGDFTALRHEPWIADADVLVGGTPCQAFSVAGLRKSLGDDRGNLSLEFIRLADSIDAAREAQGRDPAIIVWENVPGVLSVKDNAFGCFLAGLAGDVTPYVPPRGKWTNAGVVDGPQRQVAWRVLDAQYFGLAQRRRRVFVVASAREGFDPAAVLLEFEGVRRDTPPRREKREIAPTIPSRSTAGGGLGTDFDCDGGVIRAVAMEDPVPPLMARSSRGGAQTLSPGHQTDGHMVAVTAARMVAFGEYSDDGTASTLKSRDYKDATDLVTHGYPDPAYAITAGAQGKGGVFGSGRDGQDTFVTHSLRAEGFDASEDRTGRGTPLVPVAFAQNTRDEVRLQGGDGQIVGALAAEPGMKQTTYVAIPVQEVGKRTGTSTTDLRAGIGIGEDGDPMYTLQAGAQHGVAHAYPIDTMNAIRGDDDRPKAGAGLGEDGDPSFTLSKGHSHAVAYAFQPRIARNGRGDMGDLVNALNAQSGETGKGDAAPCVAVGAFKYTMGAKAHGIGYAEEQSPTLDTRPESNAVFSQHMAVRRLTPVECERLQGFPDAYTLIPWKKKPADQCPDGPRYKALGNSMAVPCMRWIGRRIAEALR